MVNYDMLLHTDCVFLNPRKKNSHSTAAFIIKAAVVLTCDSPALLLEGAVAKPYVFFIDSCKAMSDFFIDLCLHIN